MNHLLKSHKGSVLVQVLAATAVMGISFYFLTNYVISQRSQVGKTSNVVNLRFTLNSAMDYVLFGIRQKYCFSDDDILMNDNPTSCNLSHSGSVERVIMSVEQENFIRQLIGNSVDVGPHDPNSIRLNEITRYLRVDAATSNHPLFPVLQNIRMVRDEKGAAVKVDGVRVTIRRNNSPYIPRTGNEVYLDISVALMSSKSSTQPYTLARNEMLMNSQVAIYPREVGSFAMLTPNDLRLDVAWNQALAQGDVGIHQFSSNSEVSGSQGLVFQSPVFVNRNIHLPFDPEGNDKAPYSPVTFADRVYLGNGSVMSNNAPYLPRNAGGVGTESWADVRTFGGFLRGIENDGGLDAGLQYFAKILNGSTVNLDLASKCADEDRKQSSRDEIFKSKLEFEVREVKGNNFKYRFQLSNGNSFNSQRAGLISDMSKWSGEFERYGKANDGAVVKMRLLLGNEEAVFSMPRDQKVKLTMAVGDAATEANLKSEVAKAQTNLDKAKDKEKDLDAELSNKKADLKDVKERLEEEKDKPNAPSGKEGDKDFKDPAKIAAYNTQIKNLEDQIKDLNDNKLPNQETLIATAESDLNKAQKSLQDYETARGEQPEITVETNTVYGKGFWSSDRKLDISVDVKNAKNMLDSKGDLITNPSLEVLGYDWTYYRGNPLFETTNANLLGYVNFHNPKAAPLTTADRISRTRGGAVEGAVDGFDYDSLADECANARSNNPSQSFGGAGWALNFASSTRHSWNFAGGSVMGKDPLIDTLELAGLTRANAKFEVRSIVGRCVIRNTSDFITGFFACDELVIDSRTTPLRILGTFIVGKLSIAPEALRAGITWSSIYHPQATKELRDAGVLASYTGRDCNAVVSATDPVWHPVPSAQNVADRMRCNAISLRAQANPFQWTAVDPDCGLVPGNAVTSCKKRMVRFIVVEQSRTGGI